MNHPAPTLRPLLLVVFGMSCLGLSACTVSPESEEEDGSDPTAWEEDDDEVDGEKSPAAVKPGPNVQAPTPAPGTAAGAAPGSNLPGSVTCNTPECRKLGKKN